MNFTTKFVLDYETLFINHEILNSLSNCLLIVPYSSFYLTDEMLTDVFNSTDYTEEQKAYLYDLFKPFMNAIYNNDNILQDIINEEKQISNPIKLNNSNNISISITASFDNNKLLFSQETLENLDVYNFDVLSSAQHFECPILTTNDAIINLINKEKLPIDYIYPDLR